MIPKIIHYCWFGGKPLNDDVKHYIEIWKKFFPDFQIKQWDESNFNINNWEYTRQAYYAGKYAFVSDVARLYALYNEGGLYFDTDILVKKKFPEEWFELEGFTSFEHDKYVQTGIIACVPRHPFIAEFLESYKDRKYFIGIKYDISTNVSHFTQIIESHGFDMNNNDQIINNFRIFPQQLLCGKDWINGRYDDESTIAVHNFAGSWGKSILKNKLRFRIESMLTILKWYIIGKRQKS